MTNIGWHNVALGVLIAAGAALCFIAAIARLVA
jgi:hypothetical protein